MQHDDEPATTCPVAAAYVFPRLSRIEQSLSAGQDKFLDHNIRLQAVTMRHEEHHRRITLLEGWMSEQQAENRGIHRDIQSLQAAVGGVAECLVTLTGEVRADRAERTTMFGEIRAHLAGREVEDAKRSEHEAKRTQDALKRHGALMKIGMTVAFSAAGLVAVLGALHGVFAKIPLVESIALMLARLGL